MYDARLRFLVIEDEEVDRERLTRLLSTIYPLARIVEADCAEDARRKLRSATFDCVLIDYQLGDAVGAELLSDVTAHRPEVCPKILSTLHESDELIVESIRQGFSDYIAKSSLSEDSLRRVIDEALARAAAEEKRRNDEVGLRSLATTIQRSYEQLLISTADRAKVLSDSKTMFLANMSHEIRTPLNTLIGLSHLLESTDLNADQSDIVAKMRVAGRSLLTTVNDVLDRTKLDAQEMVLEHVPYSLTELLRDLHSLVEPQIGTKPIELDVAAAPEIPPYLLGDPSRLHRVLLNLLTNAIKFTDKGTVKLLAELDESETRLRISISDTGIGIKPEFQGELFAPFAQADTSTTRRFGGTGLGLSISRDLVRLMNGDISMVSEPDKGCTFMVDIPLHRYAAAVDKAPRNRKGKGKGNQPRLKDVRVLVVDDCDINLEVATRILEMEGCRVATSVNGQDAVKFAIDAQGAIDVILMDLQMPVLDGRDSFRRIVSALGAERPVVIALTAGVASGDFGTLDIGGMDGLISKPFDIDNLVATIRARLEEGPGVSRTHTERRSVAEWPAIACIEIQDVRLRLGDDVELFRSILRQLIDDYHNIAWVSGMKDKAEQSKRLNLLRASAALVGAGQLSQAAAKAAEVASRGELTSEPSYLASVCFEMSRLQSESATFLEGLAVPGSRARQTLEPGSRRQPRDAIPASLH
ncbi:hybrid sensor histidine kinase/response regulator [Novosphingobium aquimarinum]|uniref:hybrid sensor histidine kinase/response regulator n=1 Tax=Novosphingobium aquimarinum TaxID=2682494 RepID=UPI0018DB1414|nr:hybrid sensor histidine kinase/response regulator [Novosphingobium aquimarinum]